MTVCQPVSQLKRFRHCVPLTAGFGFCQGMSDSLGGSYYSLAADTFDNLQFTDDGRRHKNHAEKEKNGNNGNKTY